MASADEAEVSRLFDAYEDALVRNDLDAMNGAFLDSDEVLRFGIEDMQSGIDELIAWRASAAPVTRDRRITSRRILELGPGVVAADITFANGSKPGIGRQSQTWVKTPHGWRIVRAHVSMISSH